MTDRTKTPMADSIDTTLPVESSLIQTFECTFTAQITVIEEVPYLQCLDNTRFRIAQKLTEWTEGVRLWQVIPSTDSTGEVSLVSLVSSEPLSTDEVGEDRCILVGRVVQLGRRNPSVQFKVKRGEQKILKLTLLNSSTFSIKVSQLLKVQARRVGTTLQIFAAELVEEVLSGGAIELLSRKIPFTLSPHPTQ